MKNYMVTHTFKSKEAKTKMSRSYWFNVDGRYDQSNDR